MAKKNVMANGSALYAQNGSTEFQVVSSTGQLYQNGTAITASAAEINYATLDHTVQTISSGAPASNISGYGITFVEGDTGGTYYINAPSYIGAKKKVIFVAASTLPYLLKSSAPTSWAFKSVGASNSSQITFNKTAFSTAANGGNVFSVELYGQTTSIWRFVPPLGSSLSTNFYTIATT